MEQRAGSRARVRSSSVGTSPPRASIARSSRNASGVALPTSRATASSDSNTSQHLVQDERPRKDPTQCVTPRERVHEVIVDLGEEQARGGNGIVGRRRQRDPKCARDEHAITVVDKREVSAHECEGRATDFVSRQAAWARGQRRQGDFFRVGKPGEVVALGQIGDPASHLLRARDALSVVELDGVARRERLEAIRVQ